MPPENDHIRKNILIYLGLLVILIIVNAILIYNSNQQVKEVTAFRSSAKTLETCLDGIESGVLRGLDAGLRGYAIVQEEALLGPYHFAMDFNQDIFKRLYAESEKVHFEKWKIDSLSSIVQGYINFMMEMRTLVEGGDFEVFRLLLAEDRGEQVWHDYNSVRVELKDFLSERDERLGARLSVLQRIILYTQVLSMAIAFVIVGLIYRRISNFAKSKAAYIKEIERISKELELKVAQRTEHLQEANQALEMYVDQLKATQQELLEKEKLASIGTLAAGLGHELNNPLNFIKGGFKIVEKEIHPHKSLNQSLKPVLSAIEEGVQRSTALVNSITRLNGGSRISFTSIDIEDLIDQCIKLIRQDFPDARFVNTADAEKKQLRGNREALFQVFYSILKNAAQSIEPMGEVRVSSILHPKELEVLISDNGQGISEAHLSKVFDPFFTTRDPHQGQGLGLSLAYLLIQDHHGRLQVQSLEGTGTEVSIYLPL